MSNVSLLNKMEVEGYPGLIKTINDDEEVEDFSEESDVEEDVCLIVLQNMTCITKPIITSTVRFIFFIHINIEEMYY